MKGGIMRRPTWWEMIGLIIAILACSAAWLTVPQVQNLLAGVGSPTFVPTRVSEDQPFTHSRGVPTSSPSILPTAVSPTLTSSTIPTAAAPTPTPSSTSTATPTIAATALRILTATQLPMPTVRPEAFVFPDPIVIRPMDKAKFTLNDPIIFQWKPVEGLREDDLYLVQVDLDGNYNAKTLVCEKYTKETQVILSGDFCSGRLIFNSRYFWRVTVVWLDANGIRLARGHWPPQTREFAWQP